MEKVALVTGSSRGIGAAIATLLAREGWAVCINYLEQREKELELKNRIVELELEKNRMEQDVSWSRRKFLRFGDILMKKRRTTTQKQIKCRREINHVGIKQIQ